MIELTIKLIEYHQVSDDMPTAELSFMFSRDGSAFQEGNYIYQFMKAIGLPQTMWDFKNTLALSDKKNRVFSVYRDNPNRLYVRISNEDSGAEHTSSQQYQFKLGYGKDRRWTLIPVPNGANVDALLALLNSSEKQYVGEFGGGVQPWAQELKYNGRQKRLKKTKPGEGGVLVLKDPALQMQEKLQIDIDVALLNRLAKAHYNSAQTSIAAHAVRSGALVPTVSVLSESTAKQTLSALGHRSAVGECLDAAAVLKRDQKFYEAAKAQNLVTVTSLIRQGANFQDAIRMAVGLKEYQIAIDLEVYRDQLILRFQPTFLKNFINDVAYWKPQTRGFFKECPAGVQDMKKVLEQPEKTGDKVFKQLKAIASRKRQGRDGCCATLFYAPFRKQATEDFYEKVESAKFLSDVTSYINTTQALSLK